MATQSQKRVAAALLLSLVLALFVALIVWQQWNRSNSAPSGGLSKDTIEQIRIESPNKETIVIKKSDDGWQITEPVEAIANNQRVEPLLSIAALSDEGYSPEQVDMQASSLESPLFFLSFNERRIAIGAADFSGERHYAMVNNTVTFVPAWVYALLQSGVNGFR